MGAQLVTEQEIPTVPWLDDSTAGLLRAIIALVAQRHPNLRAAILFGSIARHDERPISDPHPSDVDVLMLFDVDPGESDIPFNQYRAIFTTVGMAQDRYLDAAREVKIMPTIWHMTEVWDPLFVENVAREGRLLWARGPLPDALAPVATRRLAASAPR